MQCNTNFCGGDGHNDFSNIVFQVPGLAQLEAKCRAMTVSSESDWTSAFSEIHAIMPDVPAPWQVTVANHLGRIVDDQADACGWHGGWN